MITTTESLKRNRPSATITGSTGLDSVDYRKQFRTLYAGSEKRVEVVHAPRMNYLAIDGIGHPADITAFSEAADALCRISLEARLEVSRAEVMEFAVMPLECIWWNEDPEVVANGDPRWTLMVMQPVISPSVLLESVEQLKSAGDGARILDQIKLVKFYEGPAAQTLTRSPELMPLDARERLQQFIAVNGYRAHGSLHEIFLDGLCIPPARKASRLLRQPVASLHER
ncbi:MAG: hypothetical protein ABR524_01260 [Thermoanaerobaculia bacterium]